MPDQPQYYDRLLAPLGKASDLESFIAGELAESRSQLLTRHPKVALRRIAYSALSQQLIPFDFLFASLTPSDVQPLLDAKDPFSLAFVFEVCCKLLPTDSTFVDVGTDALAKLLDPKYRRLRCHAFSAFALISVTNLRRAGRLPEGPLFWTRLVALTHAGLLTDVFGEMEDAEELFRWAGENFYGTYRWHTMVDRRDAPRWNPDWVSPDQLHAEIVGRVCNAVQAVAADQRPPDWASAVEAAVIASLTQSTTAFPFFPGPLDDFQPLAPAPAVPKHFEATYRKLKRATSFSDVPQLFAFAYSAPLPEQAISAVLGILSKPVDQPITNDGLDLPFLRLAAYIAGTARSEAISAAVLKRCSYMASNAQSTDDFATIFSIAVEACGAYQDAAKYREVLSATVSELCFTSRSSEYLSQLEAAVNIFGTRDEKLVPALARANAIIRTRTHA